MEETPKKTTGKKWSLELSAEEDRVLNEAKETSPYKEIGASKRQVLRMAILSFGAEKSALVQMKDTLLRIDRTIAGALARKPGAKESAPTEKEPRKNARMTDEDKDDVGRSICSMLGGTVAGRSCSYMRYEVMPTGRAVEYNVSMPLASLSEADVAKQYDPDPETWRAAKAQQTD